jgi:hypothetical protein
LSLKQKQYYINDKYPLVFYHFSGFNPLVPEILSKYQNRFTFEERSDITWLFKDYSAQLFLNRYKTYVPYPNEYAGIKEVLDRKLRREKINAIPFFRRALRIIILKLISKFQLDIEANV